MRRPPSALSIWYMLEFVMCLSSSPIEPLVSNFARIKYLLLICGNAHRDFAPTAFSKLFDTRCTICSAVCGKLSLIMRLPF